MYEFAGMCILAVVVVVPFWYKSTRIERGTHLRARNVVYWFVRLLSSPIMLAGPNLFIGFLILKLAEAQSGARSGSGPVRIPLDPGANHLAVARVLICVGAGRARPAEVQ